MRVALIMAIALLGACGPGDPAPAPEPAPPPAADAPPSLWFICDGIDAPTVFAFTRSADGTRASLTEWEKATGAPVLRADYELQAPEGAAGSVYTPLVRDSAQAGVVRAFNPGVLETPSAAYTTPITSVTLGERTVQCRWLARTRFFGVGERRTYAVTEDVDGDLIYTTFDYSDAARQAQVDLSNSQRSTTFSLEVRGGEERVSPGGAQYRFENQGYSYVIEAPVGGPGRVEVRRGDDLLQTDPLNVFQTGDGAP